MPQGYRQCVCGNLVKGPRTPVCQACGHTFPAKVKKGRTPGGRRVGRPRKLRNVDPYTFRVPAVVTFDRRTNQVGSVNTVNADFGPVAAYVGSLTPVENGVFDNVVGYTA